MLFEALPLTVTAGVGERDRGYAEHSEIPEKKPQRFKLEEFE